MAPKDEAIATEGRETKTYAVTDKAGRFVMGQRNQGVGSKLILTDKQAEAGLRSGEIVEVDATKNVEAPQPLLADADADDKAKADTKAKADDKTAPQGGVKKD